MQPDAARSFANQLRNAREGAIRDAEDFDGIIQAVERLGSFLLGKVGDLGKYQKPLLELACTSALAFDIPQDWRALHPPFPVLYDLVRNGRNDALHQGAFARCLTTHAMQLSIVLEDALRRTMVTVSDYMVDKPVCAQLWQPVSFVRQQMLANSYSCLPVQNAQGEWCLVWDIEIGKYLGTDKRKMRLADSLEVAAQAGLVLIPAHCLPPDATLDDAIAAMSANGSTVLVCHAEPHRGLAGLLTAFDLL